MRARYCHEHPRGRDGEFGAPVLVQDRGRGPERVSQQLDEHDLAPSLAPISAEVVATVELLDHLSPIGRRLVVGPPFQQEGFALLLGPLPELRGVLDKEATHCGYVRQFARMDFCPRKGSEVVP